MNWIFIQEVVQKTFPNWNIKIIPNGVVLERKKAILKLKAYFGCRAGVLRPGTGMCESVSSEKGEKICKWNF